MYHLKHFFLKNHILTARPFSKEAFLEATKCSCSRIVSANCNNTSSDYSSINIYTMLLLSKFCYYQNFVITKWTINHFKEIKYFVKCKYYLYIIIVETYQLK